MAVKKIKTSKRFRPDCEKAQNRLPEVVISEGWKSRWRVEFDKEQSPPPPRAIRF